MARTLRYLADHAIAVAALVFSLLAFAGGSYAAFTISGSQIRNRTVDPVKFNPRFINGTVRAWAIIRANGQVIRGAGHPKVTQSVGLPGNYFIRWRVKVARCSTVASIDLAASPPTEHVPIPGNPSFPLTAGYATASTLGRPTAQTSIVTYNQSGQPTPLAFDVAVIC
jgi:hypothetical protein